MHVGRSSIISSSRVSCWSEEGRCKAWGKRQSCWSEAPFSLLQEEAKEEEWMKKLYIANACGKEQHHQQ